MFQVFVPKECRPGESRVAASPDSVKRLVKANLTVTVEPGAGYAAGFTDAMYEASGAGLASNPADLWRRADIVLKVAPPGANEALGILEVETLKPGAILVTFLDPYRNLALVRRLAERRISALAMELIPRVTRAQEMDALSSQASIAGYKATLLAAMRLPKYFPLMTTAAGTVKPARVVIIGAGVAGLQAIATARRLGAVVEVSDVRAAVKEQVESLGARFIELPQGETAEGAGGYAKEVGADYLRRQREILIRHLAQADAVITTAAVPGKKAPTLLTREMLETMKPGAVVIDIAAGFGGNCELTEPDEEVVHRGVLVLGPTNLAATMPGDASQLYGRNVSALLLYMTKDGEVTIDPKDEVVGPTLVTHQGEVLAPAIAALLQAPVA